MRRILTVTAICICAISCGRHSTKTESKNLDHLRQELLEVMLDSTSSWKQVTDVVYPFVDSLCVVAADEASLKNRMFAQQWGYMVVEFMAEKYAELKEAGKDAEGDDLSKLLERISDAENVWFYDNDIEFPVVWRDHYYASYQGSEQTVNGYFHIMVTLPCEQFPEPSMQIFYPETAEGDPVLLFSKFLPGSTEDDMDSIEPVYPDEWSKRDEIQEGYPMYATYGKEVVEKMFQYDLLYIMFQSSTSPTGDPGENEIARLQLDPFRKEYQRGTGKTGMP